MIIHTSVCQCHALRDFHCIVHINCTTPPPISAITLCNYCASGVSIEAATGKFRHLLFVLNFIWVVTVIYYLINIESWYAGNGISGLLDSIIIIFLRKHAPRPLLGGGTLGPWSVTAIYLILFPTYSRFLPLTKPSHSWCTENLHVIIAIIIRKFITCSEQTSSSSLMIASGMVCFKVNLSLTNDFCELLEISVRKHQKNPIIKVCTDKCSVLII